MPVSTSYSNISIIAEQAELISFKGDGIIVPTISDGQMSEGIAAMVKKAAGAIVEEEATRSAPIAVGAAVVSSAGKMQISHIIHSPLLEHLGMRIGVENIRRATRAGLLAATHFNMEHIAIPGMGYGENQVPYDEAARAIIDEIRAYKSTPPTAVTLMATDEAMFAAFKTEIDE